MGKSLIRIFLLISISIFSNLSFAQSAFEVALKLDIKGLDFLYPFNEKNDLNKQLGRPNQYIEKVSWPDPLIDPKFESDGYYESDNPDDFIGGTIEKFRNKADLDRRYNYIKSVHLAMPMTNQYMYKKGLFLLRLDREMTPTDAKKYEQKFYKVVK